MCNIFAHLKELKEHEYMNVTEYPIDLGFLITKAPLESGLVTSALTIALESMNQGRRIGLFLMSDGVWLAKKGQKNQAAETFQKLLLDGASVMASGDHLKAAGINENDIVKGVAVTTKPYKDLVIQVMEHWRKVVTI